MIISLVDDSNKILTLQTHPRSTGVGPPEQILPLMSKLLHHHHLSVWPLTPDSRLVAKPMAPLELSQTTLCFPSGTTNELSQM